MGVALCSCRLIQSTSQIEITHTHRVNGRRRLHDRAICRRRTICAAIVTPQPLSHRAPGNAFVSDGGPVRPAASRSTKAQPVCRSKRDAGPAQSLVGLRCRSTIRPSRPPTNVASRSIHRLPWRWLHRCPATSRNTCKAARPAKSPSPTAEPAIPRSSKALAESIAVSSAVQSPLITHACGPWKPPGISGPWPEDEYLFDGGDSDGGVKVRPDGGLEGLDSEDTIAHYDTLDGRTIVKPSCRVCLYAPRFAAVRQVTLAYGDNQLVRAGGVDMPIGPVPQLDIQPVASSMQPITPVGEIGARGPITFLDHTPPIGLISHTVVRAMIDRLKPYENYLRHSHRRNHRSRNALSSPNRFRPPLFGPPPKASTS